MKSRGRKGAEKVGPELDQPLSLHPLDFESAVRAALATGKPPPDPEPKKRKAKKPARLG